VGGYARKFLTCSATVGIQEHKVYNSKINEEQKGYLKIRKDTPI
jgi:hypothetical protein